MVKKLSFALILYSCLQVIATVALLVPDGKQLNATISSVANHLRNFKGVSRRFELIGIVNRCHIYDDYAHHPTEVRAALQAARQRFPNQAIWIVFQPHTFRFSYHLLFLRNCRLMTP